MSKDSLNQIIQIGVEATKGTQVPANKLLPGLNMSYGPTMQSKQYRAQGWKFNTTSRIHKVWGEGSIDGPLSYTEIVYPLSSLIGAAAITTPSGGTLSRQWLFTPPARGAKTYKTFTLERGDATAAKAGTYVAVTDLNIDFAADDVNVKGTLMGRAPETTTLTASPTAIAERPVSSREIDVYISTTLAGLAGSGNKLTDAMKESFSVGKTLSPKWVHNTDYASFKDLVETAPDLGFDFTTEDNAQSRALYDTITDNPLQYIAVVCTGSLIEGTIYELFELIIACNITAAKNEDTDGVDSYSYSAMPIYDATLGTAYTIRVINTLTAL